MRTSNISPVTLVTGFSFMKRCTVVGGLIVALTWTACAAQETSSTRETTSPAYSLSKDAQEQLRTIYAVKQARPNMKFDCAFMHRLKPLMFQQAAYLISTLKPWNKDHDALTLTPSQSGEHDIRPNTHTAYGLAVMARLVKDGYPNGLSQKVCRDKAIDILRFVLPTHSSMPTNNGKSWTSQWQSALWAFEAGTASWLLWDDLSEPMRYLAAKMVADEADRFITLKPPAQVDSDTKAEENAWDSLVIVLAYNMLPNHPHHQAWGEAAIRWVASSFVTQADTKSDEVIDGKPLREWVSGATLHEDYTLENHDRVHPDYMHTFTMCLYENMLYDWGGNPAPRILLHNARNVYDNLKALATPDGSYVYPNGQDWGLHRNPHWIEAHQIVATLFGDKEAARLALNGLDCTELMAKREGQSGGGIFLSSEYFFPSTQHYALEMLGALYAFMGTRGCGPEAVSENELWKKQQGRHVFDAGKFALMRSPRGIASFSWGKRVMGMIIPMQKDLLVSPYEKSLVGSIEVPGIKNEYPSVRKVEFPDVGKAFAVAGVLDRGRGAAEQRFAFLALPDGRTIYADRLQQTSTTRIKRADLGSLAILNEPNWVYHNGKRTLYHVSGEQVFAAAGEDAPASEMFNSPWYNVDDALGILVLKANGRQTYTPTHKQERGRVEQLLQLNSFVPDDKASSAPLAQTVAVFYPTQKHADTKRVAKAVKLEPTGDDAFSIKLEDGKIVAVDLKKLTVTVK